MPDKEKVIKALQNCSVQNDMGCQCCPYFEERKTYGHEWCTTSMAQDTLLLLKEQEGQKRKWLQNIADNQLSIGKGVDPLTDYEQGVWDGLQMAFEIMTGDEDNV